MTDNNNEMHPRCIRRVSNVSVYDYYLDTELGLPHEYRDLYDILITACEDDVVNLFINGPGGYCNTCYQLVNLIRNCKASVIGHLVGRAYSAHSFIFLACHEWSVYPHAEFMAHSYSGGAWGKGIEILQQAKSNMQAFKGLVEGIYYPFLNREEVDELLDNNKDFWITSDEELISRLDCLDQFRIKENNERVKADKKAHLARLQEGN